MQIKFKAFAVTRGNLIPLDSRHSGFARYPGQTQKFESILGELFAKTFSKFASFPVAAEGKNNYDL